MTRKGYSLFALLLVAILARPSLSAAEASADGAVDVRQDAAARLLPVPPSPTRRVLPEPVEPPVTATPPDEYQSLLRMTGSYPPENTSREARRVRSIIWPTPFLDHPGVVARGDPMPLITHPPETPSASPTQPDRSTNQRRARPARLAIPRKKPEQTERTPSESAVAEEGIAIRDTAAPQAPTPLHGAPSEPLVVATPTVPERDDPSAPQANITEPTTEVLRAEPSQRAANTPRRNPRRAPTPQTPVALPQLADARDITSTDLITASYSPDRIAPPSLIGASIGGVVGDEPSSQRPLSADEEALLLASVASAAASTSHEAEPVPGGLPPVRTSYVFSGPSPAELARTLVRLQDDIARGSVSALRAQRVVLQRIALDFPGYPAEVWSDPRHAKGLLIYALSGGDPSVVRPAFDLESVARPYEPLVRGALAFLEGRKSDAIRTLDPIALNQVDHSVRGALALAKAALVVDDDPAAADALLARARYAAPASLIEEAALRRAILIAAERDDVDHFKDLVNRYLRKFRTSVYAGNFRRRLAAALTRMQFITEPDAFDELAETLSPMTEGGRRELYLLLARAAVEFGREEAAQRAAAAALATAQEDTMDHKRARLYLAAAYAVDPDKVVDAALMLDTLRDEGGLDRADGALLSAAATLSHNVRTLPEPAPISSNPSSEQLVASARPDAKTERESGPERTSDLSNVFGDPTDDPFRIDPAVGDRVAEALAAVDALLETNR